MMNFYNLNKFIKQLYDINKYNPNNKMIRLYKKKNKLVLYSQICTFFKDIPHYIEICQNTKIKIIEQNYLGSQLYEKLYPLFKNKRI